MGISGISAYNFLQAHGANAYIYVDKRTKQEEGYNYLNKFSDISKIKFDYAIISPGVQIIGNKNLKKLKEQGIMLLSELELGYLFCKGKFIAVTGTNGKTTCVNLLNHVLSKKYKSHICGNVGIPITSICDATTSDCVVICEVSSFMLELISPNFMPDIAVITNITPDHISRHKTFENYVNAKLNISEYQTNTQHLIVPNELKDIQTQANLVVVNKIGKYKSKLLGEFNQKNIELCYQIAQLLNISQKEFKHQVKTFSPVKFRMENLGKKRGITYINDSKSTNPNSTVEAIKAMQKPVVVLLGGSDKGNDFYDIFKLKNKIRLAVIYGQTANKLEADALFMGFNNFCKFESLNEALYYLKQLTKRGDVVLLSPACASYDEFNNYIERGEFFNKYVSEV